MPLQGDLSTSDWGVGPQGPPAGSHRVVMSDLVGQGPRGPLFFGYAATNKCCRDWLILGWPSNPQGQPVHLKATRDPVLGLPCPKCGGMIYFDIAHPDITTELPVEEIQGAQPACLVGGRLRVA